jgi:hypothetical protein
MKKMATLIVLIFTFLSCAAPDLGKVQLQEMKDKAVQILKREAYDKEFNRFITQLRAKESSDNWMIVNSEGCIGWFQFSPATLKTLGYGYIRPERFKNDPGIFPPELQMQVLKALIRSNEILLSEYMAFVGKTINGTLITRSGIIAGAHLGGATGVKMYLLSHGNINNQDSYKTMISDYMKEFQGYNI